MRKKIVFGSLLACFLMLTIPAVSAVQQNLTQKPKILESMEKIGKEDEVNNTDIFFIGRISGISGRASLTSILLSTIGVYKEIDWMKLPVEGNNIFLVNGKAIHLESPCKLTLYNVEGFGSFSIWSFIKSLIPPYLTYTFALVGNCESYQIQNETCDEGGKI